MSPLDLAPHARASLRSTRMTQLALGLILAGLGLLVIGILAAVTIAGEADADDGILPIAILTFVVAGLPAAFLLRMGLPHESRHVLVVVLENHPEKVRAVTFSYRQDPGGHTRLANVTLTDGTRWDFPVPLEDPAAPRAPKRAPRAGTALTHFTGEFVRTEGAWSGLEGAGAIEVTETALVVSGPRVRTRLATGLAVVLGAAGGFLTILFFVAVDLPWVDDPRLPAVLAIAAAWGGYAGAGALLDRALPRASVRLPIGWSNVIAVRLTGAVVEISTNARELTGIARFRTDRPEVLVAQCAP